MAKTVKDFEQSKKYVEVEPQVVHIAEPLDAIKKDGVYRFHNPRGRHGKESGFSQEKMAELYDSIVKKGLQQPIMARLLEDGSIQLIAGERRLRCVLKALKTEKLVYCNDRKKKLPPKDVYRTIPCRLFDLGECSEEDALEHAVDENDTSAPLSASDYVHEVEYLVLCGKTPKEIEQRLNKNPAWVNHYINFRTKLPKQAFRALMEGEIPPYTATKILEFEEKDRQEIWERARDMLQMKIREAKQTAMKEIEEAQVAVEIAEANLEVAADEEIGTGDVSRAEKNVQRVASKLAEAREKLDQIEAEPPTMTGSIVADVAEQMNSVPMTPRALNRKKIQQFYVDPLWKAVENEEETLDEVLGHAYPRDILQLAMTIADAISRQETDVFQVLRGHLIEQGTWEPKKTAKSA